jgi:hypothetical protein
VERQVCVCVCWCLCVSLFSNVLSIVSFVYHKCQGTDV